MGAPATDQPPDVGRTGKLFVENVAHAYKNGVKALTGVTLRIGVGMFGLLGPNGAGKSTLMRIISTLQQPSSGRVFFDGIDVLTEPKRLRGLLGYLPQEFGVYPGVSAEDLLDHLAVLKGIGPSAARRDEVHALLQRTNLFEERARAVGTFSGGMRQRFGIAQALLGNPSLIIVDEPTAGLDPAERVRCHDLLAEIGSSSVVILSTHLVEDVARLCNGLAIIVGGRVTAEGDPSSLVADVSAHLWRKPVSVGELEQLQSKFNVTWTRYIDGHTIAFVHNIEQPSTGFEPTVGTLEDVYFATMMREQQVTKAPRK